VRATAVVTVVATTPDDRVVLLEQYRPPLGRWVIEWPGGLVGDEPGHGDEALAEAAARELLEETGWQAQTVTPIGVCASAPSLSSEIINFMRAEGLAKVGPGGGVGGEKIRVHEVPRAQLSAWLDQRMADGTLVASQVHSGLWLAFRGK
jgi:ADP-ribose pyrophosphatase